MTQLRIPVKLVRIEGITEVSMDLSDFESSDTSIGDDLNTLKDDYNTLISEVKPILGSNCLPSTIQRWQACRKLSDFHYKHAKFDITNFSAACSKDLNLKVRFSLMVTFGREFHNSEVIDSIPYTSYRVLIYKMSELKRRGIFESEKARLVRCKMRLNYKEYTDYLANL